MPSSMHYVSPVSEARLVVSLAKPARVGDLYQRCVSKLVEVDHVLV